MVSIPVDTAVTRPPTTVALPLLTLQIPPGAASVRVVLVPRQRLLVPAMLPAFGNGLTFTVAVADTVPHTLVTV